MRIFKKYIPALIVRHVKTFFKERIYIQGRGGYEFNNGLLLMPAAADIKHEATVNEINHAIEAAR